MQLGVICHIGESPVFIPFGPFAVYHICLVLFFPPPRQNHWSFCKGSCYGKLSQPISNHECMRTPAGRLSTLFACVASLSGRLINQLSWLVAGLGFIRYSSGCVFIRSKQDKDTAEMQLAIVFFIDTPSSLVVHHNLEAQIFSYP